MRKDCCATRTQTRKCMHASTRACTHLSLSPDRCDKEGVLLKVAPKHIFFKFTKQAGHGCVTGGFYSLEGLG